MRRLALPLVPLFLLACTGESTAPDPTQLLGVSSRAAPQSVSRAAKGAYRETYRIDVPIDWLLTPAEFPCLSEPILVSGSFEEHLVFIESQGGIHLTVHQSTNNVTAVGQTTGATYAFSGPLTFTASGSTPLGTPLENTFHNINHIVGPGGLSNIYFRTLIHVTRDATGEPKVVVFRDDVLCH
jgi:hypothetical protein